MASLDSETEQSDGHQAADQPLPDGKFTCHRSVIGGDYEVLGLQVAVATV